MTNERTDHVAEARKCIAWAQDQQEREGEFDGSVRDNALLAQAEATLALVEQQRIANLVALAESGRTTINGARAALSGIYDGNPDHGSANLTIRADIAAALGIQGAAS